MIKYFRAASIALANDGTVVCTFVEPISPWPNCLHTTLLEIRRADIAPIVKWYRVDVKRTSRY